MKLAVCGSCVLAVSLRTDTTVEKFVAESITLEKKTGLLSSKIIGVRPDEEGHEDGRDELGVVHQQDLLGRLRLDLVEVVLQGVVPSFGTRHLIMMMTVFCCCIV